jgi:hypothetical protein
LGGKGKTDTIDRSAYGSKTQKSNDKEKDEKERSGFKEHSQNDLGGKSKTDTIDRSAYGSKTQKNKDKEKEEKERSGFKEHSQNDLGGKGKTDTIDRSAYGSKTQKNKDKEKEEKEKSGFKEDSQNDLGGKGNTDNIDRSPLGSKTQKMKQEEKDPRKNNFQEDSTSGMSGEGSTDEIDTSHYDSRNSIDHKKEKEEREARVEEFGSRARKDKSTPTYGREEESKKGENSLEEFGSRYSAEDEMNDALAPELNMGEYVPDDVEEDESSLDNVQALFNKPQDVNVESGEVRVILKQKTSAGNAITFMCQFEDFYPEELIVQAPKNSLTVGSKVQAKVSLKYNEDKVDVIVKGNILEIEPFNDKMDTLVIEIDNLNSLNYESFINLYHDRQENINSFMLKAKGY